jgi:hypothetical protein
MINITISIPYQSKTGSSEKLTIGLELKYNIDNATNSESNDEIKANAPATYYTQNRMVTGEDYQVAPLAISQEIIKVKSVNRTSSGISRYYDLLDATGKYSQTNLYGKDGIIYNQTLTSKEQFTFSTKTDIEGVIKTQIEKILKNYKVKNFYYSQFAKILVGDLGARWNQVTKATNITTGYFTDTDQSKLSTGSFTASTLQYLEPGAMLKFEAPAGYHFMPNGTIMAGAATHPGATTYKWTKVVSVSGPGITNTTDGQGPIILNDIIPGPLNGDLSTAPLLTEIKPLFTTEIETQIQTQIIDQVFTYTTFGLRYDFQTNTWRVILASDLAMRSPFSTGKTGALSSQN